MFRIKRNRISSFFSVLLIIILGLQMFFCVSANAYSLGYTWRNAKAVLNLSDMSAWSSGPDDTVAYKTANTAAANWNSNTNFTFTKSNSGKVQVTRGKLGANEGGRTVHTLSNYKPNQTQYYESAVLTINNSLNWALTGNPASNQVSLLSVLRHEYGHVIGLAHYGNSINESIMYYKTEKGVVGTIKAIDITHVNSLYTTPKSTKSETQGDSASEIQARIAKMEAEEDRDLSQLPMKIGTISILDTSIPDLVQEADNIVTGTVIAIENGYYEETSPGNRDYFSKVILRVDEILKGDSDKHIAIKMYGGTDDSYVYVYPEQPLYGLGERYIIFFDNGHVNAFGGDSSNEYDSIPFSNQFLNTEIKLENSVSRFNEVDFIREEILNPTVIQKDVNLYSENATNNDEPVILLPEEE